MAAACSRPEIIPGREEPGKDSSGRQNPLNWGHRENPLIVKLLQKPQWMDMYISFMKELCSGDSGPMPQSRA